MSTASARKGIKTDQSLKSQLEKGRVPVTKNLQEEEVSGQYLYDSYTECPYCFNVGWTSNLNSDYYTAVQCGACGAMFMA